MLVASLNALYVYACTGQGKSAVRESAAARFCIRSAARDRDYLFTEGDCAKFDSMIGMSEVAVPSVSFRMPSAPEVAPDVHLLSWPCRLARHHHGRQCLRLACRAGSCAAGLQRALQGGGRK